MVVEESEIADDDSLTSPEGEDLVMSQPRGAHITAAFIPLEAVDISSIFCTRESVMKSMAKFLKGPGRISGTGEGKTSSWVETLVDVATNVASQETKRRPDF